MSLIDPPTRPQIFLRPVATPLPVGMIALAVGSILLCGPQLKWVPVAQTHTIALCLVAFVVPLQLISFVISYLSRDEGTASALATLAGTWLAAGLVLNTSPPGHRSSALGLLLFGATAALLIPIVVTAASKPLISVVLLVTAARFLTSGLYEVHAGSTWRDVAGVIGIVVAVLAWYAAIAFALEAGHRRAIVPVFRRGGHASPDPSSNDDPFGPVDYDAAVRSQL